MTRKLMIMYYAQHITRNIKNWAESGIFKLKTFNKRCHGLIGMELRNAQLFILRNRYVQGEVQAVSN